MISIIRFSSFVLICLLLCGCVATEDATTEDPKSEDSKLNQPPPGFEALFNGHDFANWRGQIAEDPRDIAEITEGMTPEQVEQKQREADQLTMKHWLVEDGVIHYDGTRKVGNLESRKHFGDMELYVDWKLPEGGDSGVFPRNMPQVQIWDPAGEGRNSVGSGGLDNNFADDRRHLNPSKKADNPIGEWNTFHIKMVGATVWVTLNGEVVIDGQEKGNHWASYKEPPPERGPIVLQSHGTDLWFRNIFIRELN